MIHYSLGFVQVKGAFNVLADDCQFTLSSTCGIVIAHSRSRTLLDRIIVMYYILGIVRRYSPQPSCKGKLVHSM